MFENPVTACRAVALAKAGAETTPKPKKTASHPFFPEWLQYFLNRSKILPEFQNIIYKFTIKLRRNIARQFCSPRTTMPNTHEETGCCRDPGL
jgi:hypothetical protein